MAFLLPATQLQASEYLCQQHLELKLPQACVSDKAELRSLELGQSRVISELCANYDYLQDRANSMQAQLSEDIARLTIRVDQNTCDQEHCFEDYLKEAAQNLEQLVVLEQSPKTKRHQLKRLRSESLRANAFWRMKSLSFSQSRVSRRVSCSKQEAKTFKSTLKALRAESQMLGTKLIPTERMLSRYRDRIADLREKSFDRLVDSYKIQCSEDEKENRSPKVQKGCEFAKAKVTEYKSSWAASVLLGLSNSQTRAENIQVIRRYFRDNPEQIENCIRGGSLTCWGIKAEVKLGGEQEKAAIHLFQDYVQDKKRRSQLLQPQTLDLLRKLTVTKNDKSKYLQDFIQKNPQLMEDLMKSFVAFYVDKGNQTQLDIFISLFEDTPLDALVKSFHANPNFKAALQYVSENFAFNSKRREDLLQKAYRIMSNKDVQLSLKKSEPDLDRFLLSSSISSEKGRNAKQVLAKLKLANMDQYLRLYEVFNSSIDSKTGKSLSEIERMANLYLELAEQKNSEAAESIIEIIADEENFKYLKEVASSFLPIKSPRRKQLEKVNSEMLLALMRKRGILAPYAKDFASNDLLKKISSDPSYLDNVAKYWSAKNKQLLIDKIIPAFNLSKSKEAFLKEAVGFADRSDIEHLTAYYSIYLKAQDPQQLAEAIDELKVFRKRIDEFLKYKDGALFNAFRVMLAEHFVKYAEIISESDAKSLIELNQETSYETSRDVAALWAKSLQKRESTRDFIAKGGLDRITKDPGILSYVASHWTPELKEALKNEVVNQIFVSETERRLFSEVIDFSDSIDILRTQEFMEIYKSFDQKKFADGLRKLKKFKARLYMAGLEENKSFFDAVKAALVQKYPVLASSINLVDQKGFRAVAKAEGSLDYAARIADAALNPKVKDSITDSILDQYPKYRESIFAANESVLADLAPELIRQLRLSPRKRAKETIDAVDALLKAFQGDPKAGEENILKMRGAVVKSFDVLYDIYKVPSNTTDRGLEVKVVLAHAHPQLSPIGGKIADRFSSAKYIPNLKKILDSFGIERRLKGKEEGKAYDVFASDAEAMAFLIKYRYRLPVVEALRGGYRDASITLADQLVKDPEFRKDFDLQDAAIMEAFFSYFEKALEVGGAGIIGRPELTLAHDINQARDLRLSNYLIEIGQFFRRIGDEGSPRDKVDSLQKTLASNVGVEIFSIAPNARQFHEVVNRAVERFVFEKNPDLHPYSRAAINALNVSNLEQMRATLSDPRSLLLLGPLSTLGGKQDFLGLDEDEKSLDLSGRLSTSPNSDAIQKSLNACLADPDFCNQFIGAISDSVRAMASVYLKTNPDDSALTNFAKGAVGQDEFSALQPENNIANNLGLYTFGVPKNIDPKWRPLANKFLNLVSSVLSADKREQIEIVNHWYKMRFENKAPDGRVIFSNELRTKVDRLVKNSLQSDQVMQIQESK